MNTQITLSLNKSVIARVKTFARKERISLSKLAEDYFNKISAPAKENMEISALVKHLSKVIKGTKARHHRDAYAAYLTKKYSR